MNIYKTKTKLEEDGKIVLRELYFQAGEEVEVEIRATPKNTSHSKYPLRGKLSRYDQPYDPVALEDWDVLQ